MDAVQCDAAGVPLTGAQVKRLWTCAPKPANDYYSFTQFAHKLNSSEGIRTPLPSDSRWDPTLGEKHFHLVEPDASFLVAAHLTTLASEPLQQLILGISETLL